MLGEDEFLKCSPNHRCGSLGRLTHIKCNCRTNNLSLNKSKCTEYLNYFIKMFNCFGVN